MHTFKKKKRKMMHTYMGLHYNQQENPFSDIIFLHFIAEMRGKKKTVTLIGLLYC